MRKKNYVKTPRHVRSGGKKWFVIALLVLAGLALLWSLIMGEMGAVKYFRMRARENSLRTDIAHLKQDNLRLMQEVRSLKQDPAYLERLARDKIGLARPGEVVYYYGDTSK
jgi:cell division protein FtsB